jgi:hypothetical protein
VGEIYNALGELKLLLLIRLLDEVANFIKRLIILLLFSSFLLVCFACLLLVENGAELHGT